MNEKYAKYYYGIMGFSACYDKNLQKIDENFLIMFYGPNKKYVFPIEKAFDLICAIQGNKNVNGSQFDVDNFNFELRYMDVLHVLESRLKGKCLVMFTEFKNRSEYINAIQNKVVGITGFDFDGNLVAEDEKDLFKYGFANFDTDRYSAPPKEKKNDKEKETSFDA